MMTISTPTVPKAALQALTELTGESRFNVALLIALQDAVEHRLEKIDAAIQELEQKYGMSFEQFQAKGQAGELPDRLSYAVESDYFEWDGLLSRKKKLEKISQWLV
jgi:hypothetical protein